MQHLLQKLKKLIHATHVAVVALVVNVKADLKVLHRVSTIQKKKQLKINQKLPTA